MSQNVANSGMSKNTPQPEDVDWEVFTYIRQGISKKAVATHYGVSVRTIERRVKKIREYFKTTGGFDQGMDRLQGLVRAAFNLQELKIKVEGYYPAARDVLMSTGFVSNKPVTDETAAIRRMTDSELMASYTDLLKDMVPLLRQAGDREALKEIEGLVDAVTPTRHTPVKPVRPRAKKKKATGKTKVLGSKQATVQRSTKPLPVNSKRAVRGRGKPKRKDGNRSRKGK